MKGTLAMILSVVGEGGVSKMKGNSQASRAPIVVQMFSL